MLRLRLRQCAAVCAVAGLAAAGFLALRELVRSAAVQCAAPDSPALRRAPPCVDALPEKLRTDVREFMARASRDTAAGKAALPEAWSRFAARFPFLKPDPPGRLGLWFSRDCVPISVRKAVAVFDVRGADSRFLDPDGSAFAAPSWLYQERALPIIKAAGADARVAPPPAELARLARSLGGPLEALQSAPWEPASFAYAPAPSPKDGREGNWTVSLAGGAEILWGSLDWNRAKLARLSQVMSDLKDKGESPALVDLRFFGDGRIYVKSRTEPRPGRRAARRLEQA